MSDAIRASETPRQEIKVIWALAWPVVLGLVGHMGTSVVDIAMVGRLGKEALASVALAHLWCFALVVLGRGILQGVDPIVTQAHGAGDKERVAFAFQEGFAVAFLVTIPLIAWHFIAAPGLGMLNQPADRIPDAAAFARVLALGVLPMMLFNSMRQCVQGLGLMRPAAISYVVINVFNIALNYGLMNGAWGLPELGMVGCAWSTSICMFIQLGIMWMLVRKTLAEYWVSPRRAWNRAGVGRVLRFGIPVGFQIGFEVWAFVTTGLFVGWLGETELAAHTVALNMASVAFMMALGVSQAATTRVGNLIGAGQEWGLAAWCAIVMGCLFMTVTGAVFYFFPEPLARLYTGDEEVLAIAVLLIPIAAGFQIFDGIQNVAFGILRGAGDVRMPMAITGIGLWLCGLPAGVILAFNYDMGAPGIWVGLVIGLGVMSALLIWRVRVIIRRGVEAVAA
jgi:MATE family multidrug resistance protein